MHFDSYGLALDRDDVIGACERSTSAGGPSTAYGAPAALGVFDITVHRACPGLVRSDVFVEWMATDMLCIRADRYVRGTAKPVRRRRAPRARSTTSCAGSRAARRGTFSELLQDAAALPSFLGYRRPAAPTAP